MKFKIGDRVQIKDWSNMAEEYGVRRDGNIRVPFTFVRDMKLFCKEKAVIINMTREGEGRPLRYLLKFNTGRSSCSFSEEMFTVALDRLSEKAKKENERRFDETLI